MNKFIAAILAASASAQDWQTLEITNGGATQDVYA